MVRVILSLVFFTKQNKLLSPTYAAVPLKTDPLFWINTLKLSVVAQRTDIYISVWLARRWVVVYGIAQSLQIL